MEALSEGHEVVMSVLSLELIVIGARRYTIAGVHSFAASLLLGFGCEGGT